MSESHSQVFGPHEEFVDGDVAHDCARLEQRDELVRQGQGDQTEALGERDVEEDLGTPKPQGLRSFDLPLPDRLEAAPEDFRLVADRVEREGEEPGPEVDVPSEYV